MIDPSEVMKMLKGSAPAPVKLTVGTGEYECLAKRAVLKNRGDCLDLRVTFVVEVGTRAGQWLVLYRKIREEMNDDFKEILMRELDDLGIDLSKMKSGKSYVLSGRFVVMYVCTDKYPMGSVHSFRPIK